LRFFLRFFLSSGAPDEEVLVALDALVFAFSLLAGDLEAVEAGALPAVEAGLGAITGSAGVVQRGVVMVQGGSRVQTAVGPRRETR
jgi:hypothetical protein